MPKANAACKSHKIKHPLGKVFMGNDMPPINGKCLHCSSQQQPKYSELKDISVLLLRLKLT